MVPQLLGVLLLQGTPARPSCTTADPRVELTIAAKRDELHGQEYCQYRHYDELGDVDGDGVEDLLVVFTIEGAHGSGNDSIQFLAVFGSRSGWRPTLGQVARRGQSIVQAIRVRAGVIDLATLEYAAGDPMCCPSKAGHLLVSYSDGKLRIPSK